MSTSETTKLPIPVPDETSLAGANGGLAALPLWIRGITVIGIPGAIALFLVWMGAKEVPKIYSLVEQNNQKITYLLERQTHQEGVDLELFKMLQRICANTARNDDERSRCFDK